MQDIDNEIAAYEGMRDDLEAHHMVEWVVMRDGKVIDTYSSFENASNDAVSKFGKGSLPYPADRYPSNYFASVSDVSPFSWLRPSVASTADLPA